MHGKRMLPMEPLIEPVNRRLLETELGDGHFLRNTNNAGNEIYTVTAAGCPNVMREIGRLREYAFREAGGGTGAGMDIDALDLAADGYTQLVVWDPAAKEIIGGYRYVISRSSDTRTSTEHYFRFSDKFRHEILPYTIELGRSFVQPKYQSTRVSSKSLYALDNLWDGLGALMVRNPHARYFFGKVTMYGSYNREARDTLLWFLRKHFPDRDDLIEPLYPVQLHFDSEKLGAVFTGCDYKEDFQILIRRLRELGEFMPPLINSYISLSPSMRVFGTVHNPDFGDVEETAILVTIDDIYPNKAERHTKGL